MGAPRTKPASTRTARPAARDRQDAHPARAPRPWAGPPFQNGHRRLGGIAVALGVALLVRRSACTAHGLAAVFWFVWAVGLLLALSYGSLAAWGSWLHVLVVSAVHRHLSGVGPLPDGRKNYTKTKPLRYEEFADCEAWWGGEERAGRAETPQAWKVSVRALGDLQP
jgi:hypothetical protein